MKERKFRRAVAAAWFAALLGVGAFMACDAYQGRAQASDASNPCVRMFVLGNSEPVLRCRDPYTGQYCYVGKMGISCP